MKKIAVGLFLFWGFLIVPLIRPPQAQAEDFCSITLTTPSGKSIPTEQFRTDGELELYNTSWLIPFDVPATVTVTFQDPNFDRPGDCATDISGAGAGYSVEVKAVGNQGAGDRDLDYYFYNTADSSCDDRSITFTRAFTANDFSRNNRPDDPNDGLRFTVIDKDNNDLCAIELKIDDQDFFAKHRTQAASQCETSQECTTASGTTGRQLCVGTTSTDASGNISCNTAGGGLSEAELRCTVCRSCADATYCYPGCQGDDPSDTETYSAICQGYIPECGNKICEAGEGQRSSGIGGSAVVCAEDCGALYSAFSLCDQVPTGTGQRDACQGCSLNGGLWTAVGCVGLRPENIIRAVVQIGLSLAGGVSVLMILAAGFTFTISQGEQQRVINAREMMTSAIVGLLFVIFSVTILQFIGVSIFQIPGFGG